MKAFVSEVPAKFKRVLPKLVVGELGSGGLLLI